MTVQASPRAGVGLGSGTGGDPDSSSVLGSSRSQQEVPLSDGCWTEIICEPAGMVKRAPGGAALAGRLA
jgi:hypothetical protein